MRKAFTIIALPGLVAACSSAAVDVDEEVVAVDGDTLTPKASITVNGWVANALAPAWDGCIAKVKGTAIFTGSGTTKAGFCVLRQYLNGSGQPTTCTGGTQAQVDAQCASSPTTLPTGGNRYCTNINGTGTKYCFYRTGANTTYCAGSPATGLAISPGTYQTGWVLAAVGGKFVDYACFAGCSASDPSVSSTTTVGQSLPPNECK